MEICVTEQITYEKERVVEVIDSEGVHVLCDGMEDLKLFLIKGLYGKVIGIDEIGVVCGAA